MLGLLYIDQRPLLQCSEARQGGSRHALAHAQFCRTREATAAWTARTDPIDARLRLIGLAPANVYCLTDALMPAGICI